MPAPTMTGLMSSVVVRVVEVAGVVIATSTLMAMYLMSKLKNQRSSRSMSTPACTAQPIELSALRLVGPPSAFTSDWLASSAVGNGQVDPGADVGTDRLVRHEVVLHQQGRRQQPDRATFAYARLHPGEVQVVR